MSGRSERRPLLDRRPRGDPLAAHFWAMTGGREDRTGLSGSSATAWRFSAKTHRLSVMHLFAAQPVSPTVTVSAPGSGYVRSAAVHAGMPGHPAADAGDCTQATKRQAPRRTVMIMADCVPYLFRQMGDRHGNSPVRRIRRGRSGRYHCSSGLCWPMMTREDPGGRAVA